MISTLGNTVPLNDVEKQLQPWEQIAWSKNQQQIVYRDWATSFTFHQQTDKASLYYNKALDLKKDDPDALYFRSLCLRDMAESEAALKDALLAEELDSLDPQKSIAVSSAYYYLNDFEIAKASLHNNTRKYSGAIIREFTDRIIVVDKNLKDCLGDSYGIFFREHSGLFEEISKTIQKENLYDNRPLWKQLSSEGKCDVLSILEKESKILSPLELARRERTFNLFYQIYFDRNWQDVQFLRSLQYKKKFGPSTFVESTNFLQNLISTKYGTVRRFIKKLHARSPLYNEYLQKYPNQKYKNQLHQNYLNNVQFQTRRKMFRMLRTVKRLRSEGKVMQLVRYVQEVIDEYVLLKTYRVMPWKFEFVNEVYNTVALAFADLYVVDEINLERMNLSKQLFRLLRLKSDNNHYINHPTNFVFGNKLTFLNLKKYESKLNAYKKIIGNYERRLLFSKYSIEKCYVFHEMARSQFKQARFDECCLTARKAIDESRSCKNYLFAFLAQMLIVKSHASLQKIEHCKDALVEASVFSTLLKSDRLCCFVDTALSKSKDILDDMRARSRFRNSIRRRKSSVSGFDERIVFP